ncbi:hypothetical protein D3C71_1249920 [compost metagenome]
MNDIRCEFIQSQFELFFDELRNSQTIIIIDRYFKCRHFVRMKVPELCGTTTINKEILKILLINTVYQLKHCARCTVEILNEYFCKEGYLSHFILIRGFIKVFEKDNLKAILILIFYHQSVYKLFIINNL